MPGRSRSKAARSASRARRAATPGTQIEVSDLFFAVPARLKFLRSDRAEANAVTEAVRRLALAHPDVGFTLSGADRLPLDYRAATRRGRACAARMAEVIGGDFLENAMPIAAEREGVRLSGFAGLPTFNRANSLQQFMFVNGRPLRDPLLTGALRAAYADVLARDRFPVAALFLELDPAEFDVNVHPAKLEVRFRDPGLVRGLSIGAIRDALAAHGFRAATQRRRRYARGLPARSAHGAAISATRQRQRRRRLAGMGRAGAARASREEGAGGLRRARPAFGRCPRHALSPRRAALSRPLGAARAQLHAQLHRGADQ